MKKFTKKTRVALLLLLSISMASASQRSWNTWSGQYSLEETGRSVKRFANDTYESARDYVQPAYNNYARPVYDYARNNPYKAGAIGVGVVALTVGYKARARIKDSDAYNYVKSKASTAGDWINKNVYRKIRYSSKR